MDWPKPGGLLGCDCGRKWQDWVGDRNAFRSDVIALENGRGHTWPQVSTNPPPTLCYGLIFHVRCPWCSDVLWSAEVSKSSALSFSTPSSTRSLLSHKHNLNEGKREAKECGESSLIIKTR